jgi:predicted PurR-regulated permease PerM
MDRAHEEPDPPSERSRRVRIELPARTLLGIVATVAAVWLLVHLWTALLVIVVALILVGTLHPVVVALESRRFPRGLAVLTTFLGVLLVGGLLVFATVPPLVRQLPGFIERAPATQAHVVAWLAGHRVTAPLADWARHAGSNEQVSRAAEALVSYSPHLLELLGYAVTVLFLALYLMLDRGRVRGALFSVVPREYHVRLARVLLSFERIVGGYVRGQLFTSALMGAFVFALLSVLRVPNALPVAVFGGLADVLPYVGAILTMVPAVLAALSRGPVTAIVVLVALGAYEEIEGRIIIPRVYGRVLRLPSSIVIVALLVGGTLMGIVGALLALPIAAGIRMIVEELRLELPGEDVDTGPLRARDAVVEEAYVARTHGAPVERAAAVATEIAERSGEPQEPEAKRDAAPSPISTVKPARSGARGSRLQSRAVIARRSRSGWGR